jgi:hypothetical protein
VGAGGWITGGVVVAAGPHELRMRTAIIRRVNTRDFLFIMSSLLF